MAELKKVLKNQLEELSKDFKELNVRPSSGSRRHIGDERDDSSSIQFFSDKYDELLSSHNVEKKELQRLNSRLDEIAEYLNETLYNFSKLRKTVCIMGDFNIDLLKYDSCKYSKEFLNSLNSCTFSLP